MKRPQVSVSVDSDVFERLHGLAEADRRSLSQITEQAIYKGIDFVERELKQTGRLPARKKPAAKSAHVSTMGSLSMRIAETHDYIKDKVTDYSKSTGPAIRESLACA